MEEEKKYKEIELRSEEVQEVMGRVPPWILRWGIAVLLGILLILLCVSFFYRYPDVITAEVTITTVDPPVSIIARATGKLDKIYVENNSQVSADVPLAVIQNPARTEDILWLSSQVSEWITSGSDLQMAHQRFGSRPLQLGSVQGAYSLFLTSLQDYRDYKSLNYYPQKIAFQQKQLSMQHQYYGGVVEQNKLTEVQSELARSMFQRDSALYQRKILSDEDFEVSKNSYLQSRQTSLSVKASAKQSEMQLTQGKETLLDLQQQSSELENRYMLALRTATEQLVTAIKSWERDYLMVSPISGTVNLMGVWSNNQNVLTGETVFTIVPAAQHQPKGKALLPVQGSGKVKVGQRVNVRLNNFPDQEFGYLIGRVESISNIPTPEGFYVLEIVFPSGLTTNYDRLLPLTRQMAGSAEIITDDLRLIERFLMPVHKLIQDQRSRK